MLEEDFERYGVRYIAIMDNIDSDKSLSDIVPMQDLFNEWHAKNTRQKVRSVKHAKGNAGIPMASSAPYGYKKCPAAYEVEQSWLNEESEKLHAELAEEKQTAANSERFLLLVRSYTENEELSPTILHEFIEKIVVHAPDKSSGKRKQKVEIFYNAVGIIDVPGEDEMEEHLKRRKQRRSAGQAQKQIKTA